MMRLDTLVGSLAVNPLAVKLLDNRLYKSVSCNYTKSFKNKTTLNIVNVSYSFTQFSTLAKIYTITAREPSIYVNLVFIDEINVLSLSMD